MVAEDLRQFRPDPARVADLDGQRDLRVRPAGEEGVEDFEEVIERGERPPVEVAELQERRGQLPPSGRIEVTKPSTSSSQSRSCFWWVMTWGTLRTNRNPSGVRSRQPLTIAFDGTR